MNLLGLDQFDFRTLWSPWFMLSLILVGAAYLLITGPLRDRFTKSEPVKVGQKILFLTGLFVFYIAKGSPLFLLSHLMFSMSMLSMALAYLLAVPLLILGTPSWLFSLFMERRRIKPIISFLMKPLITLLCFNALFSFYHMPYIHDFIMTNYPVYTAYSVVFLSLRL